MFLEKYFFFYSNFKILNFCSIRIVVVLIMEVMYEMNCCFVILGWFLVCVVILKMCYYVDRLKVGFF